MTVIDIINKHGIEEPKKIAHIYKDHAMSYKELLEKSNALASYLIETYGEDKTPIVVYGAKEHEMLICFLACVKSGHAYIPVESSFPYERVKDIVENSGTKLIFNIGMCNYDFQNCKIKSLEEITELINRYKFKKPDTNYMLKDNDVYYILYTSGSTGKPKGVQITLSCIESFIKWGLSLCNGREKNSVFMNQAPFSFDLSVMDLYLSLASGATLYSIDKTMISSMKKLFEGFETSNIGIWVSTPSFADMCLSDSNFNESMLPNLKLFLFCGETLTNSCVEKLKSRFKQAEVINMYGPTEATVAVTSVQVTDEICNKINPLPVGKVKDDCIIKIVDKEGKEVLEGEKGEIIIAGDSVSLGYYKNEEKTKKVFSTMKVNGDEKRCFKTGDEGYIKEGMLYYQGRIDFQIKLNGFRIELEDIENNLRKLKEVKNCIVIPIIDNEKIKYLSAAVVLNKEITSDNFSAMLGIKKNLKEFLPEYMIPRKIVIKESLPMTTNGKVDRKVLSEEIK